jgi:phosphoketolase
VYKNFGSRLCVSAEVNMRTPIDDKFLNPKRDGCVLPILDLKGYKIANPRFLARIPRDELQKLFEGMVTGPSLSKVTTRRRCID